MKLKIGAREIEGKDSQAGVPKVSINGTKWDLTTDFNKTNGSPTLQFEKDGLNYYIREKFGITSASTFVLTRAGSSNGYYPSSMNCGLREVDSSIISLTSVVSVKSLGYNGSYTARTTAGWYIKMKATTETGEVVFNGVLLDQSWSSVKDIPNGLVYQKSLAEIMPIRVGELLNIEFTTFFSGFGRYLEKIELLDVPGSNSNHTQTRYYYDYAIHSLTLDVKN